ncbi:Na+/H+ antiporter subunit D [Lysinibacter sp. HNR]|uniref:Na+/H+ antiporter subunit D n=1 Tax=Lysinibacter sp. HNR TaxID=3031408 RepID=UPI002434E997|nr:Na+/H+ antiporter subunit D [Lysinibacter sp. HNR]WGD36945.1 Na+/H+ antiporter subunit D [Lysinibacter sp. HNR]
MTWLIPLMVALPLLGSAVTLILSKFRRLQILISVGVTAATVVVSVALLIAVDTMGTLAVQVGGWAAPWGISLVVDRLASIMLVISAIMLLGVLVYSVGQGIADGDQEAPVSIFHPTYLILAAGLFNVFIAGDLFNIYVGFEMLLAASYVLLTLGSTGVRVKAGTTYIVVSLVSSIFFLLSIALIYGATGTVNLAQLSIRLAELPADIQLILNLALLIGFGVKAAVYPVSFWLPDSYPTAPAPVTAVFAGLLTKVGVYAIIRTETLLFPGGQLNNALLWVALFTLLMGILGAVAQADIKRLLSFTLVSHIGYMIFGIALATVSGLAATVYYITHHITVQTTLFLATGLIERIGGTTSINRLAGLLKAAPLVSILFFIPALNLGGIPPFSGFIGKVALFIAGAEHGGWLVWTVIGVGALTSLLTLYSLMRIWNTSFWRTPEELKDQSNPMLEKLHETPEETIGNVKSTTPKLMVGTTTVMVGLTLCLTVFAGPILEFATRTAEDLLDQSTYVTAVFDEGVIP